MDGVEELLIAWGDAQSGRHETYSLGKTPDVHILAKARQFAPVTKEKFIRQIMGRDGRSRRAYMVQAMNGDKPPTSRMRLVPMWAVDPVPCSSSKKGGGVCNYAADSGLPPHLRRVDLAAMELYRADLLAGVCLRMQYLWNSPQTVKAEYASRAAQQPVSLRQYREHLRRARHWMRIRLGVDIAVTGT